MSKHKSFFPDFAATLVLFLLFGLLTGCTSESSVDDTPGGVRVIEPQPQPFDPTPEEPALDVGGGERIPTGGSSVSRPASVSAEDPSEGGSYDANSPRPSIPSITLPAAISTSGRLPAAQPIKFSITVPDRPGITWKLGTQTDTGSAVTHTFNQVGPITVLLLENGTEVDRKDMVVVCSATLIQQAMTKLARAVEANNNAAIVSAKADFEPFSVSGVKFTTARGFDEVLNNESINVFHDWLINEVQFGEGGLQGIGRLDLTVNNNTGKLEKLVINHD